MFNQPVLKLCRFLMPLDLMNCRLTHVDNRQPFVMTTLDFLGDRRPKRAGGDYADFILCVHIAKDYNTDQGDLDRIIKSFIRAF